MQPEIELPDNTQISPWHYVTIIPTFLAITAVLLSVAAWFGEWGGGDDVATSIAITFSSLVVAVSLLGIVGYPMQATKCQRRRMIALWNLFLLLLGALSTAYLMLGTN